MEPGRELALVATGGALGSVGRDLVQLLVGKVFPDFPGGTVIVNVVGCVIIGVIFPQLGRFPPAVKPLVMVGFLGGLTTMSSYAVEVVALAQSDRVAIAMIYAFGAVALCFGAAWGGFWMGSR